MSKQKILIVDDEPGMREMLHDLLEDMGCELYLAKDGKEAIEVAVKEKPDLLLLDIMLPEKDGFTVCREIRANPEIESIPVIMLTGHNTEESARKGLEVGAEDVLAKPFNMAELKLRIRTVLQLNRFRLLAGERAQFKWVIENSQFGFLVREADDRISYMNPRACTLCGLESFDAAEDSLTFGALFASHFERVPDPAWEAFPKVKDHQLFIVRPETEQAPAVWLKIDVVPGSEDSGEESIIRLADVSEEMIRSQNMWQFEHMVSHKLRTPLMGLLGSLDTLEDRIGEIGNPEDRQLLQEALRSGQRLHQAIQGILEHVSSRQGMVPEGGGTGPLRIEHYARQLATTLGLDEPEIDIDASVSLKQMKLSEEELVQILQELLTNSQKFHPTNQASVLISLESDGDHHVALTVSDNGRHVSQDVLEQIGSPFYQPEKYFTGEVPGMGLGLSMISTMLTTRGGRMLVKNREDCPGLSITLRIPADWA